MQLSKYDPFDDLKHISESMENFWRNRASLMPQAGEPAPLDLYEEDGKMVAEIRMPQFKKEEIKITSDNGLIEVSAEHEEKKEEKDKRRYFLRESSNRYLRKIGLPRGVDAEKAKADFKEGVLKIVMPVLRKPEGKIISLN